MRNIGTVSRGVRAPILKAGDDIVSFVVEAVVRAQESEGFEFREKDVVCVTESLVARAQGNYVSCDDLAEDIRNKFPDGVIGLYNPILSRNRFSMNLKGIARGAKKLILQLNFPTDEVGNELIQPEIFIESGVNPFREELTEQEYREKFGKQPHPFTGIDYVDFYREVIENEGCEAEIFLANDPTALLNHTKNILTCDIHTRKQTKNILAKAGAEILYNLEDLLTKPINGSGYNEKYGLLGSNKSTEEKMKLFPRDCEPVVENIQKELIERTGKQIEVMIYGDGAFKDPVGRIWELADPVVSPAFTEGLIGVPNEVKIKYIADSDYGDLEGQELTDAVMEAIRKKDQDLKGNMVSEGTTPRKITDLLGSLADLTSGSGDKGTPIVLIQGYFDNLTN